MSTCHRYCERKSGYECMKDILGVGPAKAVSSSASGKNVFTEVSVAFGGGNTADTVEPAKAEALCGLASTKVRVHSARKSGAKKPMSKLSSAETISGRAVGSSSSPERYTYTMPKGRFRIASTS